MSKKIVTTRDEKKPVLKIVILVVLAIAVIAMTLVLLNNKKENSETSNNDNVDTIDTTQGKVDNNNEVLIDESASSDFKDVSPVEENTDNLNNVEQGNLDSEVNEIDSEDQANIEDTEEDVVPVEQWETSKDGPRNPEVDINLSEEQIAKSKTGGYYDSAYVPDDEFLGSFMGPGYTEKPDSVPRFYNFDNLPILKEIPRPEPSEYLSSTLKVDTLKSIDRDNVRNMEKIAIYENHFKSPIYENASQLRTASESMMQQIEDSIGIRANEEYYEQLIKSEVIKLRNKIYKEAMNKNNPYNNAIRAYLLRGQLGHDAMPGFETYGYTIYEWYDAVAYFIDNGGEIDPKNAEKASGISTSFPYGSIYQEDLSNIKVFYIMARHGQSQNGEDETAIIPSLYAVLNNKIYDVGFKLENGELKLATIWH